MGENPCLDLESLGNVVEWIVDCHRDSYDGMVFGYSRETLHE